ncbi:fibrinogen-like protein A [Drosophila mojavensis]|uniref:fibrinogen-like protein A n=1 Tax=Drosophila mojavensis TaxID=7230 RepID=UPI001CD0B372|nr:fibrinogen-like protein A [Drosophila mojavensis]
MSQMLQLDALVTMLACLTTTQTNVTDQALPPDDATSSNCPLATISNLNTKIHSLSEDLARAWEKMGILQEQLVDLRRWGIPNTAASAAPLDKTFSTRILDVQPQMQVDTPQNCLKQKHGVARIRLQANIEPFFVYCDQKTRGGGWTVVANRFDGTENFKRNWSDYKIGFGSIATEFFIGLEKLHQITSSEDNELLVILENRKQEQRYALYDHFSIGSESEQYSLNVLGEYQGDASDALRQHLGKKFSTQDRDNDESGANCAAEQSAAFWYSNVCTLSNPFGVYQPQLTRDVDGYQGILWHGFLDGPKGSLKKLRILVRPRSSSG